MSFSREINRLMLGTLILFFIVTASATYWAIVGTDTILLREDNPRAVEDEAVIQRGSIYDRNDNLLAETVANEEGFLERHYLHPESYSALGYFSLRYGVTGAEAAYDSLLRGDIEDELAAYIKQDILHLPQVGADIRLSLDENILETLVTAMKDYRGAAVVLSVPDGEVLALLSLPDYDPNILDEEWENLVESEGNPFFNRVLQGQYQAGGILQTPLMAAGILTEQTLDTVIPDANLPITVNDVELSCAVEPEQANLTYTEAYAYACPRPFSILAQQIRPSALQNIINNFRLDNPPMLNGFVYEEPNTATEATPELTPEASLIEDILGQGDLTINPLGMATLAGAIINEGNAPQPHALLAYRLPEEDWIPVQHEMPSSPMMTIPTARGIYNLMLNNVTMGASRIANIEGEIIGGHAALAISGDETQAWFIGFIVLEDNRGAAIALVLENSDDATLAAEIAGQALEATANSLRSLED